MSGGAFVVEAIPKRLVAGGAVMSAEVVSSNGLKCSRGGGTESKGAGVEEPEV